MRLLERTDTGDVCLTDFNDDDDGLPLYAILSHTWGAKEQEVSLEDLRDGTAKNKLGYKKIQFCKEQAWCHGLRYFWVDTCCIDKRNNTELQTAINCMFRWYRGAAKCFVYLADVSSSAVSESSLQKSRWFTRGWTLQELIAPTSVEFFSKEEVYLGDKSTLETQIHDITKIPVEALRGSPLSDFSVSERMKWIDNRETTRREDMAYSLFGIFDVLMPLLYGEGRNKAFTRLWEQINKSTAVDTLTQSYKRHLNHDNDNESTEPPSKTQRLLSLNDKQKQELLNSLRFDQIDARYTTIKRAHAKTCKWLLKNAKYVDWLDPSKLADHHGFLWIKGKPGTGKSTLMKFALADAWKKMKDKIVIAFFFNARGDDLEKSTLGMYRSLLVQLLEKLPELQDVFGSVGFVTSSVESLKELFEEAVMRLGKSSLVCFIDALDECDEQQIRDMTSFFESIGELSSAFKVCFSSRHYPHITISTGLDLVLEGEEGHGQDIVDYVGTELRIGHSKNAQQIRVDLQEKASGIFVWACLVVDILNKEHDEGRDAHRLRKRLRDTPGDLHRLFYDILTRDGRNKDELLLCIQWLLFARKPLKPEQLYHAILSGTESKDLTRWDQDEMPMGAIERNILNASKGLAEITKSKKPSVQFIHESVKDYLLKEKGLQDIWNTLGSNFGGQSHDRLKQCCDDYMSIAIKDPNVDFSLPEIKQAELFESVEKAFPLFKYAIQNVLRHADAAEDSGIDQTSFIQSFRSDDWIKLGRLFNMSILRPGASLSYIFADQNLVNLIRCHPDDLSGFDVEKQRYGTPILVALVRHHQAAVGAFLSAMANSKPRTSPLHDLCRRYVQDEERPEISPRKIAYTHDKGVLGCVACLGNAAIFDFFLFWSGAHYDSVDDHGRTSLSWAARYGCKSIVELLLEKGANVEAADKDGRTPLWWAVHYRNTNIVDVFFKNGANVEAVDKDGRTPLSWTGSYWDTNIVELLLKNGANVEAADNNGRTPLSWAVEKGCEAVIELLLKNGANVKAADNNGRTPLWWAFKGGYESIVELLLKNGRTPLSWAAGNWHKDVVDVLLKDGAYVEAADKDGRTALWCAEKRENNVGNGGRMAIVKLLREKGSDIKSVDKEGGTSLS